MNKTLRYCTRKMRKDLNLIYSVVRNYATALRVDIPEKPVFKRNMKGWSIHSYGEVNEELQYSDNIKIPMIKTSSDVLIKIRSSGVNPIDIAMVGGYGSKFLNLLRCNEDDIEFPLILGREFSGVIIRKGMECSEDNKVGDVIWGVVPVNRMGCHAEYVVVPEFCISKIPKGISTVEAGGILYAGLTAWSGLFISGLLGGITGLLTSSGGGRGKHVLVLGASGGVGSSAVQILKAENASVVASCSTDAISIVKNLGADHVIDYTNQENSDEFSACGPYDIILDCAGLGQKYIDNFKWSYGTYVTFSSPLLRNIDDNGIVCGMIRNAKDIININAKSVVSNKGLVKWGYFIPSPQGIEYLKDLVERKKFLPLIDTIYDFNDAKSAYCKVKEGHLRGRVILDLDKMNG